MQDRGGVADKTRFVVSFTIPYLLNKPYANLGSQVGFIYGSVAAVSLIFCYFCVPDCAGRTLEEIDVLFESNTPIRSFRSAQIPPLIEDNKELMGEANMKTGGKVVASSV
jgi:MFS transporter, SP family, sugar:H+ symporter